MDLFLPINGKRIVESKSQDVSTNDNHTQMLRADSISHLVTCCCCGYMLLWLHCGGFVWRHVRSVESSAAGDGWSRRERGRGRLEVVGRWSPQIPAPREPLVDCAFSQCMHMAESVTRLHRVAAR